MNSDGPRFEARPARNIALRALAPFPIAFFSGALLTDIAYARTANMMWADFSAWLLAAAMATGVLAALAAVASLAIHRRAPSARPAWPALVAGLLVLVAGMFDNLVHSRDAWTSVVPTGLALSALTVILILITAWLGLARGPRVRLRQAGARQ